MSNEAIVSLVLGVTAILVLIVLAPWRSPRRDALGERETYSALWGEDDEPS
ncbi:MAG: hypothetical protein HYU28_04270 [Actinobacteria bacterium]|nr:hypothetical protein [Actinomycetota bacterium]